MCPCNIILISILFVLTALPCGTPSSLSNGQRHYNSTTVGSTVTYTCNTGYRMTAGNSSRTCLFGGHWSGSHPTCSSENSKIMLGSCGTPRSLTNGQTSYTSTTVWSIVTYTCDPGYVMTAGNSSRICQSVGLWSGNLPSCTRKSTLLLLFLLIILCMLGPKNDVVEAHAR